MSLNSNQRPPRSRSSQEMWPRWMWVAVPALVVVVGLGLYWALFSSPPETASTPSMTPTMKVIESVPTQAPTTEATVSPLDLTPTRPSLPPLATFTPTPLTITTPETPVATAAPTSAGLAIGGKATVAASSGLKMRSAAGTSASQVKTLANGSVVEILDGPQEANDYTWWQVRDEAGITGWVAGEYLEAQ
jgi:uncharacterized protein YgiM (DUF1202 family)